MTLKQIDPSGFDPVKPNPQEKGVFDNLLIEDLLIDDDYQREVSGRGRKTIKKITENFDWAKFSPVIVSRRENCQFAIIDGQHRTIAAAVCGFKSVPAMILSLSPKREAEVFTWINSNVTALTQNQIFRAALAAGEGWAIQCNKLVSAANCRLMSYNKNAAQRKEGEIFCVNLVRKFVDRDQGLYLKSYLQGLVASDIGWDVRYYNSYGLNALLPGIISNRIDNPEVICDFLNKQDLDKTAIAVNRLRETPEYERQSFKSLFQSSVAVLLRAHAKAARENGDII